MRLLIKIVLSFVGFVLLLFLSGVIWFRYYTRDLPDIDSLAQYSPVTISDVSGVCLKRSVAIPYDLIGGNLLAALNATEKQLPEQISRTMFCSPSKQSRRQLDETHRSAD